jgi:diaminopimelate epimerase
MTNLVFTKMHGLGNDFVVFDARNQPVHLSDTQVRAIADRKTGVGFDQMIVVGPPTNGAAAASMTILNADGGEVEACGNATRCVASILMAESGADRLGIETVVGLLYVTNAGGGHYGVDFGPARHDWQEIPLAEARDTLHLDIAVGPLVDPVAVNVGNPHAVFVVEDVAAIDLETHGPVVEHHPLFPVRINVEAIQILTRDRIRMRVWERGVGVTRACGTGACAALIAANLRGLTDRRAEVILDGGPLDIEWRDDGHVIMTGPVALSFTGSLDSSLLKAKD